MALRSTITLNYAASRLDVCMLRLPAWGGDAQPRGLGGRVQLVLISPWVMVPHKCPQLTQFLTPIIYSRPTMGAATGASTFFFSQ